MDGMGKKALASFLTNSFEKFRYLKVKYLSSFLCLSFPPDVGYEYRCRVWETSF